MAEYKPHPSSGNSETSVSPLRQFRLGTLMKRASTLTFALALLGSLCGSLFSQATAAIKTPGSGGPLLPPGVTAVAGQVLRLDGKPLADVTLKISDAWAVTTIRGAFCSATTYRREGLGCGSKGPARIDLAKPMGTLRSPST